MIKVTLKLTPDAVAMLKRIEESGIDKELQRLIASHVACMKSRRAIKRYADVYILSDNKGRDN